MFFYIYAHLQHFEMSERNGWICQNLYKIFSEIEPLKRVMLHRPGAELENLMPDYLEDLLFDDIPFLAQAQQEHDFLQKF